LAELVDQATLAYREGRPSESSQPAAVGQLASALLTPWYNEPPGPAASQLLVVPDGRLAYLPFEILALPDGQLLADQLTVRYAPSLPPLIQLRARPAPSAPGTFVAFADPMISEPVPAATEPLGAAGRTTPGEVPPWADDPAAPLLPAGHELSPL